MPLGVCANDAVRNTANRFAKRTHVPLEMKPGGLQPWR